MEDVPYTPSLGPDSVEPADVEMAAEKFSDIPMIDVCMAQPLICGHVDITSTCSTRSVFGGVNSVRWLLQ